MTKADNAARTARALNAHRLSLAEHYVMCSAGHRVTLPPDAFVAHTFSATTGDRRGTASLAELSAALERLQERGLLTRLSEADLREEVQRATSSQTPEVIDIGWQVGHVDFTPRGYAVHREVIRAIHGDAFLERKEAGWNLNLDAGRFDVYAVSSSECSRLMEVIEADADLYTGSERARVIGREGPSAIGPWRPNRFVVRETGYHGVLRFRSGDTDLGVAWEAPPARR